MIQEKNFINLAAFNNICLIYIFNTEFKKYVLEAVLFFLNLT